MKYLLSLIIILMVSYKSFAQENKLPKYYIQNGDTIGIVYSIEQAQKIYNEKVLLTLFKDLRLGCDTLFKKYSILVNKYDQKQLIDNILIEQLQKSEKDNLMVINKLETKVSNLEEENKRWIKESGLKDGQLKNDQQIIDTLKNERSWLLGGTIGFGILSIFLTGMLIGN